jgi:hypothetical protein
MENAWLDVLRDKAWKNWKNRKKKFINLAWMWTNPRAKGFLSIVLGGGPSLCDVIFVQLSDTLTGEGSDTSRFWVYHGVKQIFIWLVVILIWYGSMTFAKAKERAEQDRFWEIEAEEGDNLMKGKENMSPTEDKEMEANGKKESVNECPKTTNPHHQQKYPNRQQHRRQQTRPNLAQLHQQQPANQPSKMAMPQQILAQPIQIWIQPQQLAKLAQLVKKWTDIQIATSLINCWINLLLNAERLRQQFQAMTLRRGSVAAAT